MKTKKFLVVLLACIVLVSITWTPAFAVDGCSHVDGWVKVDSLSGLSYSYTAPEGQEIVAWCYKAGVTVETGQVNPPTQSYTVTSTVSNPTDNSYQELSHASFLVRPLSVPTFVVTSTEENLFPVITVTPTYTQTETVTLTQVPTETLTGTVVVMETSTNTPVVDSSATVSVTGTPGHTAKATQTARPNKTGSKPEANLISMGFLALLIVILLIVFIVLGLRGRHIF